MNIFEVYKQYGSTGLMGLLNNMTSDELNQVLNKHQELNLYVKFNSKDTNSIKVSKIVDGVKAFMTPQLY